MQLRVTVIQKSKNATQEELVYSQRMQLSDSQSTVKFGVMAVLCSTGISSISCELHNYCMTWDIPKRHETSFKAEHRKCAADAIGGILKSPADHADDHTQLSLMWKIF